MTGCDASQDPVGDTRVSIILSDVGSSLLRMHACDGLQVFRVVSCCDSICVDILEGL